MSHDTVIYELTLTSCWSIRTAFDLYKALVPADVECGYNEDDGILMCQIDLNKEFKEWIM